MATVNAFHISSLKLWFWSLDHDPPHFHAKKSGEWEVKVLFLLDRTEMVEVKWAKKQPSASLLKQLCNLAEKHRIALLAEWESLRGA